MKKIWLVSHYAMPPHLEVRIKTLRYARILQSKGYEVLLITASTIHNSDINLIEGKELFVEREYEGLKYVHIKCDAYKGSGIKRIINMLQFQKRFKKVMSRFEKPDIIVADCNCVNYRGLIEYARKNDVPFVTEVRDLWPLSIVEYKNISEKNPVIKYLYSQERRMYRLSDAIVFSMEGGKDYIIEKGWDKDVDLNKVFYINNGLDVEEQTAQRKEYTVDDADLNDDSLFKVIYAGSVRTANCVDLLVKTAEILRDNENIKFLIYGDGDKRAELEQYCSEKELANVEFKGKVDKKYIPFICSVAGVNVLTYKNAGTWKYGGSQNKMFDYLNAGKPVITNIKIGYSLLEKYGCGLEMDSDSPQALADAVTKIYDMPKEEYAAMCENAANAAKDFDYKILTDKLEEAMKYAVRRRGRK